MRPLPPQRWRMGRRHGTGGDVSRGCADWHRRTRVPDSQGGGRLRDTSILQTGGRTDQRRHVNIHHHLLAHLAGSRGHRQAALQKQLFVVPKPIGVISVELLVPTFACSKTTEDVMAVIDNWQWYTHSIYSPLCAFTVVRRRIFV